MKSAEQLPMPAEEFLTEPSLAACLKQDFKLLTRGLSHPMKKLGVALGNRGMQAVFAYRISRALWRLKIPVLPSILTRIVQHLYAIDISYRAYLGPGIVIFHGFGLVIGCETRIAGNCWLYQGVTFGDRGTEWVGSPVHDGHPTVGRGCIFGAGAKVLGRITIGSNSVIGANAVVLKSSPANSIVVGIPARVVGQRPPMDEDLRVIQTEASCVAEAAASTAAV